MKNSNWFEKNQSPPNPGTFEPDTKRNWRKLRKICQDRRHPGQAPKRTLRRYPIQ